MSAPGFNPRHPLGAPAYPPPSWGHHYAAPGYPPPPGWDQRYAAPAPYSPVAVGVQMKYRNPFGVWLGLPLITLGIYYYVWLYKIHYELGLFDRRRYVGAVGPVLAWIFGVLTLLIWPLISTYNTGQTIANAQRAAGLPSTCSGAIGVVLVFFFNANFLYYQTELNRIIEVNPVPERTQIPLWV